MRRGSTTPTDAFDLLLAFFFAAGLRFAAFLAFTLPGFLAFGLLLAFFFAAGLRFFVFGRFGFHMSTPLPLPVGPSSSSPIS